MARNINFGVATQAAQGFGVAGPYRSSTPDPSHLAGNWTLGPVGDREPGNACVGIAIGCLLSLPIWLAFWFLYLLLG